MISTTVLAAGTSAATSADITVEANTPITVSLFLSGGATLPAGYNLQVVLDTPGDDLFIKKLDSNDPATQLVGPGIFRVVRPAGSVSVGVVTLK